MANSFIVETEKSHFERALLSVAKHEFLVDNGRFCVSTDFAALTVPYRTNALARVIKTRYSCVSISICCYCCTARRIILDF